MTIGLLVCDEVRPEYRAEFKDYPDMFQVLFPTYEFKLYQAFKGELPGKVEECDCFMATGSSHSVYEDLDWIKKTKAFIKRIYEENGYFIGFCFGHQLMAEALGGKVAKAKAGWCVGVHEFKVFRIKQWMRPAKTKVNFLMMCQDQVMELPKDGVLLAGNDACPNAILQVGNRMLSIQGHPEFTKAYNQVLMEGRVERMGEEKVGKGIASLEKSIDLELFRSWVGTFLEGN